MIVELHNDDGTKTTYFGVSDFSQRDGGALDYASVTEVFLNNNVEAEFGNRQHFHYDAVISTVISEGVLNEQAVIEHIGDRLVEPGHEIVVGIPAISHTVAYALAKFRRWPDVDADDNLTIIGQPDPGFPDNDTSEVDD